jgi:hypothetical protein|tara:strand:+ start:3761 stop:4519 length:759 start_codon:yes stop_codon:yes gene_type:complete
MSPSEIKENVNKIKELLKSEDFGVVNNGLELARSLDEEAVYEKLLEGCGADKEGRLVNEKKEISDYLVCSLASISYVQKAKEILDNVTELDLNSCKSLTNIDGLANLKNLKSLDLDWCESLTNVDGLANLTKLTSLSFKGGDNLGNMDAMKNLTNLEYLNLYNSPFNLIWYDEEETGDPDDAEVEYDGLSGDQLSVWFSYMFGDKHERAYKGWIEDVLEDGSNGNVAGLRHQLYRAYYKNLSPHIENEYPEM